MKQRVFLAAILATALAGCASGVKLDNPAPVTDATAVSPGGPATGNSQSQVSSVTADEAAGSIGGPASVAKIVYFDYDSNSIKPEFQGLIEGNARWLTQHRNAHVVVEGNTDERGGSEYNLALGQRRAEAVRQALELLGVQDSQVEAVSYGKEKPAVDGHDEAAWAKNRRAEIAYRR